MQTVASYCRTDRTSRAAESLLPSTKQVENIYRKPDVPRTLQWGGRCPQNCPFSWGIDGPPTHPFNCPFSGSIRVSQYQKGKTNLDFSEARDSEWQWHQLGRMQVCTSLQTDNHASTPPLSFFTDQMPFLPPNHSVKTLKALMGPHLKHNSLGPPECISQMLPQSVQPFCRG